MTHAARAPEPEPTVSVVVPCRDEARAIAACLESVVATDFPKERLEVLVVDGMSEDGTREVVRAYARRFGFIRMVDNPQRIVPAALNAGIRAARGSVIVRFDTHAICGEDYIARCVRHLRESGADNVGGRFTVEPGGPSLVARAIAAAMTHPFGLGAGYRRLEAYREPTWVDAVPFGCFRKELVQRVGGFDERLERGEDTEFNLRVIQSGGRVLFAPDVVFTYVARRRLGALARHAFAIGYWASYARKFVALPFSRREWTPAAFVASLLAASALAVAVPVAAWWPVVGGAPYLLASVVGAAQVAVVARDARLAVVMPLVFGTLHVSHAAGVLWGALRAMTAGARAGAEVARAS